MSRSDKELERRTSIMKAAVEVFSRKGYHGCRIADVAREAGVAYGLVYHYFQNKDELLESVFTSGWAGFVARLEAAIAKGTTVEEQIHGIVHVAFEAYRTNPKGVKVLILEVGRSPAGGAVNRGTAFTSVIQLVAGLFRHGQARGEVDPAMDPVVCAAMVFGAIEMGLTSFVMGLLDRKDEVVVARAKDQVARGLVLGLTAVPPQVEARSWKAKSASRSSRTARRS